MERLKLILGRPVPRYGAGQNLRLTLLCFAATVALTRLFLSLTGYPQIGNRTLHISHLLWGGLLLFAATLLMMLVANNSAFALGAVLGGVGMGLFMDEVGKFITRTNDYFYPAAAPIIYAFFLLTVLLYVEVSRPAARNPRRALYHALERLQEVIDRDLEPGELARLKVGLAQVMRSDAPADFRVLGLHLSGFLDSGAVRLVPERINPWKRFLRWATHIEGRFLGEVRLRGVLTGGLAAFGALAAFRLAQIILAIRSPQLLQKMVQDLVAAGRVASASGLGWFSAGVALQGSVGLVLLLAAVLLGAGRAREGVALAYLGLLLTLTTVDLVAFYFDQFSTILPSSFHFLLFLGVLHYRRRYLESGRADRAL